MDTWKASNWNWEKIYRAFMHLTFLAYINWFFQGWLPLSVFMNTPWMRIDCAWMSWQSVKTPWMQFCAHEHLWVMINIPECNGANIIACEWVWTPPECDWVHSYALKWMWRSLEHDWVHEKASKWGWLNTVVNTRCTFD